MPLYEYQCDACGTVFEKMQKFSDAPLTEHENCGGSVRRLLSAPALQFKGTGWYVTDYARGGSSKSSSESNGGSKPSGDAGKTDSSSSGSAKSDSSSSTTTTSTTASSDKK